MQVSGVWNRSLELEAGEDAVALVHCNSHGCGKWNSAYNLFRMDSEVGSDQVLYSPASSNLDFILRGTQFQFTPTGMTAGTINVGTLNATTVNGAFQGSFSGNVTAASIPLFGASGATHAAGAVPDPGAVAGFTRFLREDGTWVAVSSGGSGGSGTAGPAGPAGPTGATGATGATGPIGATGATGATGAIGATGAPGAAGPAGANGADGLVNPRGSWSSTTIYAQGDAVTYGAGTSTLSYVSLAANNTGNSPLTAFGSWSAYADGPGALAALNSGYGIVKAAGGGGGFTTLDTLYDFGNQTGTTVSDRIGSANGILGGSTLPTWTGTGLSFGSGANVALPAALNTEKTFYFAVYVNPIATEAQITANVYPPLLSSSTGATGLNVILQSPLGITSGSSDYTYAPTLYPNAVSTASPNTLSGFAVLTLVCGNGSGNLDHFYLNGTELSYTNQSSNCGAQTSGNLVLGSSGVAPWTNGFFPGTFYGFAASASQHTAAQVQQNTAAFVALAAGKGVPTAVQPVSLITPQLLAAGTSITFGANAATPYTSQLSLTNQPAYSIGNYGIIGLRLSSIISHEANRLAPRCSTLGGPGVALLEGGTNDIAAASNAVSVQTAWNDAAAWAALMRKAGCTPFMLTMLSRIGNGFSGQTMDTLKDSFDALIVQQAVKLGFAGVLDIAANPLIGADGANAGTPGTPASSCPGVSAYFQSDCIHPTTAGNALMAKAVSNGLNWYFGYNESNPHVVTTLSGFTMACSDGSLDLGGVTAAGNITLPDCTGASGATFRFNNAQSAVAITITPDAASHPLNGLSTAVTLPANASLTLRLVPNPKSTAGWHWEF